MNFLAHQYLSFQNPEIQLGNLYGEIIRGKDYLNFSGDLKKGILLHRQIDSYTDAHPVVKKSSRKFHEKYGKYAPVIVDVVYDYFLILNWKTYTDLNFEQFVSDCYSLFQSQMHIFPEKLQFITTHLIKNDWFHNYQTLDGIKQTLKGISQRSKFRNNMEQSIQEIIENHDELNEEFNTFFPDLEKHCLLFIEK